VTSFKKSFLSETKVPPSPHIQTSYVNSTPKPVGADEGDEGEEVLLSDDAAVLAKLKESIQNPGVANRRLETNVGYFLRL